MNKYLQTTKESIFSRIINKVKSYLYKTKEPVEEKITVEEPKNNFIESLRVDKEEPVELLELKDRFENGEISEEELTDEQVEALDALYDRLIEDIQQKIRSEQDLQRYKRRLNNVEE